MTWLEIFLIASNLASLIFMGKYVARWAGAKSLLDDVLKVAEEKSELVEYMSRAWTARSEGECIHEARHVFRKLECADQDQVVDEALKEIRQVFEAPLSEGDHDHFSDPKMLN